MRYRALSWIFTLVGCLALGESDAHAQGRGGINPQQNQLGGLGQQGAGGFNAGRQAGVQAGARAGQRALGAQQQNRGGLQNRQLGGLQQGRQRDSFIGSDAQQLRDQFRNQNQNRRRRAFDFEIENLNQMRESSRQGRGQGGETPSVRVKIRPLFDVPLSSPSLNARLQTRLDRALPSNIARGSRISVSGSTATIQGSVQSEYDKKLAAKLISILPGVTEVENRLTIASDRDQPLLLIP